MAKQFVTYNDFSGGWNADTAPDLLQNNELAVAKNAVIDKGPAPKRGGFDKFNAASFKDGATDKHVEALYEWRRNDGTTSIMAVVGTSLVKINSGGTAVTTVKELSDEDVGMFTYGDKFYFTGKVSGVDTYWCYNDASAAVTFTDTGDTVSLANHGLANGTPVVFSNVTGTTGISAGATYYVINSTAATTFQLAASAGGTALPLTTNGTGVLMPTVSEVVPASGADLSNIKKCRDFVWHPSSQRIFASRDPGNPQRLYWSELGNPTYFKAASFVVPTTGDGPVAALENFGTSMVALFASSAWSWTGVSPTADAKWQKIPIATGCVGKQAVCMTPDTLSYVDVGGVYAMQLAATNYDIVAVTGQSVQRDLSRDLVATVINGMEHRSTVQTLYDKANDRLMIAYGDDSGNARNNKILIYQWKLKAWAMWEGIAPNCMLQLADGTLLVGSKNYILKYDDTIYKDFDVDAGTYKAISWEIETKGFPLAAGANLYNDKRLYKMVFAARQFLDETPSSVTVKVTYDYRGYEFEEVDLMESLIWDDEWGEIWGFTDIIKREVKLRGKGARVSVNYTNSTIDENVCIYGQAFVFKTKKLKGTRTAGGVDIG